VWVNNNQNVGHNQSEESKKIKPDYTIKSFKEIIKIEKKFNK